MVGGKFHIAAAISQLARWWNCAELAASGRGPKLHEANSKALGKGGAFWEAGAVVGVDGSDGTLFAVSAPGLRTTALVNMTKSQHHCSLAACSRLSYPC
jgi:hypothetical protein